jgi:ATP synthase protein I
MTKEKGGDAVQPRHGAAGARVEKETRERLQDLDRRLSQASRKHVPPPGHDGRGSALGLAFRLAVELVAGLVVGGGIGWLLDTWLGTMPVFLLIFFALGAAAGILNVIRTAKQMQVPPDPAALDIVKDDDD